MKLLILYGPPAVGKTTVGAELAKLTGYRFFFNHLTVPAAKAIFPDSRQPYPDERYTKLLHRLRLECLDSAADVGLGVIFTVAYSGSVDDDLMEELTQTYTSRGGTVHFVELHAPKEILLQRVSNPDRAAWHLGKMTKPEHLLEVLDARDMYASVQYPDILKLDTSQNDPATTAEKIIEHFHLKKV